LSLTFPVQEEESVLAPQPAAGLPLIALLGKLEKPADGVNDYCHWLGCALRKHGWELERVYMPWPKGWISALIWLWRQSEKWRGQCVSVQYTAFSWSRTGFPFGFVAALIILRLRQARISVVLHDPGPCSGMRIIDRLRRGIQIQVLRTAYNLTERSIFTVELDKAKWLKGSREKAAFIPVGANMPGTNVIPENARHHSGAKEIAVFCLTGGVHAFYEAEDIGHAVLRAKEKLGNVRLLVMGRNVDMGEAHLRVALANSGVDLEIHGVLPAEAIERRLSQSDVLLFVRQGISTRRGSAIAGISCGLPLVAYSWKETGFPVTEAGVVLVPSGNRDALAEALIRVLEDDEYRAELRRRSWYAREQFFSWDAIAARFSEVLDDLRTRDLQA
jgi:glycosyltransferase involved in cell wall biosynthesis